MSTPKPFAPACERNRDPILEVLRERLADSRRVLEIGSGTGQHAVHFAAAMPWLEWQTSDVTEQLPGIRAWLADAALPNTPPPIALDLRGAAPASADPLIGFGTSEIEQRFDAVFSANTLHIVSWSEVEDFFVVADRMLQDSASLSDDEGDAAPASPDSATEMLIVYGPFNYGGAFTSDSNRDFDGWLKARDPESGIRDFESVDALARGIGCELIDDIAMPANNRCLVWRRSRKRPL